MGLTLPVHGPIPTISSSVYTLQKENPVVFTGFTSGSFQAGLQASGKAIGLLFLTISILVIFNYVTSISLAENRRTPRLVEGELPKTNLPVAWGNSEFPIPNSQFRSLILPLVYPGVIRLALELLQLTAELLHEGCIFRFPCQVDGFSHILLQVVELKSRPM